ncbi:hypothetical protein D3C78_1808310 [compost metagenome]
MDVAVGPAQVAGAFEGGVDHAVRAAGVHVAAQRAVGQDLGDVQARIDAFAVKLDLVAVDT